MIAAMGRAMLAAAALALSGGAIAAVPLVPSESAPAADLKSGADSGPIQPARKAGLPSPST